MKKFVLSIGVILTFIAYSFQQRGDNAGIVVAPKATTGSNGTAQTSPSATSSSSSSQSATNSSSQTSSAKYKDGSYTGQPEDAYYGYVQVKVTISGGKISDVTFLQHPSDQSTSRYINSQAMPYLQQEAIQAQSSHVNIISGATDTSMAFIQSLSDALNQAQNS